MWEHEKIACDLFYLLPKSLAGTLRAALDESGDFDTWWSGTGHFMYNFLPPEVQEHQVHFTIDEGWLYHTAGQDGPNVCNDEALGWRPPNMRTTYEPEAWMFINRECSASLCVVHLVGCVVGRLVGGEAVPLPLTNGFHVDAPLAVPPSSSSPSPPLPQSPPYPPGLYCPSSCVDALQHGVTGSGPTQLCLRGGDAPITLWCDMETAGGGWAYVARGTDPTNGRQTEAYGLPQSDPGLNERWSLGEAAIDALNEHGTLEFFVTIGPGNGPGYVPMSGSASFAQGRACNSRRPRTGSTRACTFGTGRRGRWLTIAATETTLGRAGSPVRPTSAVKSTQSHTSLWAVRAWRWKASGPTRTPTSTSAAFCWTWTRHTLFSSCGRRQHRRHGHHRALPPCRPRRQNYRQCHLCPSRRRRCCLCRHCLHQLPLNLCHRLCYHLRTPWKAA